MLGSLVDSEESSFGLRKLELSGRSFYCRDGLLEIWLAVVADQLAANQLAGAAEPWQAALREELALQARVKFNGLICAELDSHLGSVARVASFTALCRAVRARLLDQGFAPGALAMEIGGERWSPAMPARLVRIADAVLWLLHPAGEAQALPS
jgi:hypothetical protein